MKRFLRIAAFLSALTTAPIANAATCFWVGGTNTYSTANGVNWASGTGGTASTCAATGGVPKQAGDIATFDALSGGGTVTVDATMNGATMASIVMGAFTGTLDFSVNNPSMTLGGAGVGGLSITGTGVRTLKLGSGTFTLKTTSNNCFDATTTTNLTFDTTSTATFNIVTNGSVATQDFVPGSLTFPNITYNVTMRSDGSAARINSSTTFKAITFSGAGVGALVLPISGTVTVTNALAWNGSASNPLYLFDNGINASRATLAVAVGSTINWASIANTAFTGTTVAATNSFDLGNNSGVTITGPSAGGGGGFVIGS